MRHVLAIIVAFTLTSCADRATPDAEILELVGAAESSVESRDLRKLRALIADDYSDKRGHHKKEIEDILRLLFITHQSIHLLVHVESIEFTTADNANVVALVGMADTADSLPNVDLYQFDVQLLRQDNNDWQVIGADWRRGLGKNPHGQL